MPVYPISFSIPESKIVSAVPPKSKRFGHIVPGDLKTYIFETEETYYKDYQESIFGKTVKKGGWDTLRHYEILANGCCPWFEELATCPDTSLPAFPKELIVKAMASTTPEIYLEPLLQHTRDHLSCRATAQRIFDTVGIQPKSVLFFVEDPTPDYQRCLTLIGMKQILKTACVESNTVPHIYSDFGPAPYLYGKGFTYTNILDPALKSRPYTVEEIKSHEYDLIVYGSVHRGLPHWDLVTSIYSPDEVIALCGEDEHPVDQCAGAEIVNKCSLFVREFLPEYANIPTAQPHTTAPLIRCTYPKPGAKFIR